MTPIRLLAQGVIEHLGQPRRRRRQPLAQRECRRLQDHLHPAVAVREVTGRRAGQHV
jgi:hypothetical protein